MSRQSGWRNNSLTLRQALSRAKEILVSNNVEDASLECELLLRHTLAIGRVQLFLDLDCELNLDQEKAFLSLIRRRLNGEPSAYITRHREFYGLDFYIEPHVFIPRPESELLVEKALNLAQHHPPSTIAEIGTGCGAIAIALALNLPQAKVYATDISASTIKVALINCQKHGVANRVHLLMGDMLQPIPEPVDLIVANLPYVKKRELSCAVNLGPRVALNGGTDGLQKIRQLCQQLGDKLRPGGCLLLEIGQGQARAVTTLLRNLFPKAEVEVSPDLSGIDRVVRMAPI